MSGLDTLHLILLGLLGVALLGLAAAAAALWRWLAPGSPVPRQHNGPRLPWCADAPEPGLPSEAPEDTVRAAPAEPAQQTLGRDLRTALNAVLGHARLARDADDLSTLHEALARIEQAGQQMLHSIREHLPGEDLPEPSAPTPTAVDEARLAGLRVLLVEDQAVNREVAMRLLARVGVHCASAPSGAHALGLACGQSFDAVLMDLNMHGLDGLETSRRLQALPGFAPTPIIALTAEVAPGTRARCAEAGIVDFLSKPIEPEALHARLARWCRPAPAAMPAPLQAATRAGDQDDAETPGMPVGPEATPGLDSPPGFDFAAALRRADGDEPFLRRLLRAFVEDFAALERDLQRLREDDRRIEAARLLHAFKGVASTVGGHQLAAQAAEFEAQLTGPDEGWPWARLPAFLADWSEARQRLAELLQEQAPARPASLDTPAIDEALDELEDGLRRADPTSEDLWEDLRPTLSALHAEETAAVDQALRQFAFDEALAALLGLRAKWVETRSRAG